MANEENTLDPVFVSVGKQKKKRVKEMINGQGRLAEKIGEIISEAAEESSADAGGREIIPVVVVVERKRGKGAANPIAALWGIRTN